MDDIFVDTGESISYQLVAGEPNLIKLNRAGKYKITFYSGTVIKGTITPNNGLGITPMGDIADITIVLNEESMRVPTLVAK